MQRLLLLVEDESAEEKICRSSLADDYAVIVANSPDHLENQITAHWPDLIILNLSTGNLNLPDLTDTLTQCDMDIPVIAIADDNLPAQLKVKSVLQSSYSSRQLTDHITRLIADSRFYRWDEFVLDTVQKALLRAGNVSHLTPKLFALFMLLIRNEGRIVSRGTIMQEVWETDYLGDTRTLDVHIRWLREKMEDNPSKPHYLLTVRGAGYRFVLNRE